VTAYVPSAVPSVRQSSMPSPSASAVKKTRPGSWSKRKGFASIWQGANGRISRVPAIVPSLCQSCVGHSAPKKNTAPFATG
jgi:hypothetical protein